MDFHGHFDVEDCSLFRCSTVVSLSSSPTWPAPTALEHSVELVARLMTPH